MERRFWEHIEHSIWLIRQNVRDLTRNVTHMNNKEDRMQTTKLCQRSHVRNALLITISLLCVFAIIVILWIFFRKQQPYDLVSGKSRKRTITNTSKFKRNKYCSNALGGFIEEFHMPRGPESTYASNMSVFRFYGKNYMLVRYVPVVLDDQGDKIKLDTNKNYTGLFRLNDEMSDPKLISIVDEQVPII